MNTNRVLVFLSFLSLLLLGAQAQVLEGANNAANTEGGKRFDSELGIQEALKILSDSIGFVQSIFHYGSDGVPEKQVTKITFTVEPDLDNGYVAITIGSSTSTEFKIQYNAKSVGTDNVVEGIKGVLYHEMTHVWQWNGQGTAISAVIEGVADYVRLKAGFVPSHWKKAGEGDRWDQSYEVTAYFFDYCTSLRDDFVWRLNAELANSQWDESIFQQLLGKSVQDLWTDYKKKYSG